MSPEALAALERGCCTRAQAAANGCWLCVPRYAAIDRVREELDSVSRERDEAQLAVETWLSAEADALNEEIERMRASVEAAEALAGTLSRSLRCPCCHRWTGPMRTPHGRVMQPEPHQRGCELGTLIARLGP